MKALLQKYDPQTLITAALVAVGLGYAIYWLVMVITWVPYPYQIDYGEGYNLFFTKLWASGTWNWDISTEPYITLMYGPVYFILTVPFTWLFGLNFAVGRTMMAIATAVSCVFVGLIVYQIAKSKLLALLGGLLPLTQPIIRDWGMQSRVDPLATMFSIIGIWIVVKFKDSKWFWLSPIFLTLSFYTKVNMVGIVAVVVFLLFSKKWKKLITFTIVTGMLTLVPLLAYRPLLDHMIFYNYMPRWDFAIQILLPITMFLVPIAGILLIGLYYMKWNKSTLTTIWMIGAVVISSLLLIKKGSSHNYYLEAVCAISVIGVLGLPLLSEYLCKLYQWRWAGALVAVAMILPIVTTINPHVFPMPDAEYTRAVEDVIELIGDTEEPVPTENAGLVVIAGKELLVEPMLFTNMANMGRWDESKYVHDIETQRFDYLVLRNSLEEHLEDPTGHFTTAVSHAMADNYSLVYEHLNDSAWWYLLRVYEANDRLERVSNAPNSFSVGREELPVYSSGIYLQGW